MFKKILVRTVVVFGLVLSTCSFTSRAMPTVDKNGEGALMEIEKVPFYEYKSALAGNTTESEKGNQLIWITDKLELPDYTMSDGMQVFKDPFNTGVNNSLYIIRKIELPTALDKVKEYKYTLEVYTLDYQHGG